MTLLTDVNEPKESKRQQKLSGKQYEGSGSGIRIRGGKKSEYEDRDHHLGSYSQELFWVENTEILDKFSVADMGWKNQIREKKIKFRDKDSGIYYFQKCTKIRSFCSRCIIIRVGKIPGLKKTSPVGFFGVFFYIFAQKREFLGFFHFQEYFEVHPDFKL
jgi:hypothetical protein